MFNPAPLFNPQLALFVQMTPDVAVMLCRYLTIRDVETMGSTCKAARAQFLKLKQRPDFWANLVPHERHLKNDWSRPNPFIPLRPATWQGSDQVELAMNQKGDYLFVRHQRRGPGEQDMLVSYPRTSQTPLKFDRGIQCDIGHAEIVGMDNDAHDPGVYLRRFDIELCLWNAKKGLSVVREFPKYSEIVAHSRNNILYLNAITKEQGVIQLIAQQFKITEQGLVEMEAGRAQEGLPHGDFLLKLSPGGQSLMVIDQKADILLQEYATLVVRNSKNLKPRTGRIIRLRNFHVGTLADLSITDCGGTVFYRVNYGNPQLSALDREVCIWVRSDGRPSFGRMAHSGDGKQVIRTDLVWNLIGTHRTYQAFTLPKTLTASLEMSIRALVKFCRESVDYGPLLGRTTEVVMSKLWRCLPNDRDLANQLKILQDELKRATPQRLAALSEEFCDIELSDGKRIDNVFILFLYDLANCLEIDDEHEHIKNFIPYWLENNAVNISSLFDDYSRGKKAKHEMMQRFVNHTRGHGDPISLGHLLLDLCRRLPKGPTLAEVLCQSRHASDRALHKLIPKRLAKAMLKTPALCNYVILAALMRKMITWTDDHKKKAHLQATHDAMIRAAEAEPNLRFDADRLMNDRHENCDTVFQCLQDTPYYKTMMIHFNVPDREHQAEHRPRQWGC